MEKIRYILIIFFLCLLAVLTFSLTKGTSFLDRGIELKEEPDLSKNNSVKEPPKDPVEENAKIIWKNYLFFPQELSQESGGFGPDGVMNHARNLFFADLNSGKLIRLFNRKVYIWDYFPGEFKRKGRPQETSPADSIDLGQKLIIIAITEDTNKDGFLNQKDGKQIFLYDPEDEKLQELLPENCYFEKLLFNTRKNLLAAMVKKVSMEDGVKTEEICIFSYDTASKKSHIIQLKGK